MASNDSPIGDPLPRAMFVSYRQTRALSAGALLFSHTRFAGGHQTAGGSPHSSIDAGRAITGLDISAQVD